MSQINSASSLASQLLQGLLQQSSLGSTSSQQQTTGTTGSTNPFGSGSSALGELIQLYSAMGGNVSSLNLPSNALSQYLNLSGNGSTSTTIPQYQNLSSTQESGIKNSSMYSTLKTDLQDLGPSTTMALAQAYETDSNGQPVLDANGNPTYNDKGKVQYLENYISKIQQGGASGGGLTTGSQQEITAAQNVINYLNSNQGNDQQVQNTMQVLSGVAQTKLNNQSVYQNTSNNFFGNDPDDDFQQVEDALDKSTQAMNAAVNGLNDDDGSSDS